MSAGLFSCKCKCVYVRPIERAGSGGGDDVFKRHVHQESYVEEGGSKLFTRKRRCSGCMSRNTSVCRIDVRALCEYFSAIRNESIYHDNTHLCARARAETTRGDIYLQWAAVFCRSIRSFYVSIALSLVDECACGYFRRLVVLFCVCWR